MNKQITQLDTTNLETVRNYFDFILEAEQSGEEFPVNFDLVWPLAYSRKDHAKTALVKDFYEGEDYKIRLPQVREPRNRIREGMAMPEEIFLTTKCLEFFIARKVRAVFEVYRQCRIELVRQNQESIRPRLSRDLVALALEQMLLERGSFRGTVAQLHHRLTDYLSIRERESLNWPKTPSDLGTRLRAITPELLEEGIELRRLGRQSHGIMVEIVPASKIVMNEHFARLQRKVGELHRELDELERRSFLALKHM